MTERSDKRHGSKRTAQGVPKVGPDLFGKNQAAQGHVQRRGGGGRGRASVAGLESYMRSTPEDKMAPLESHTGPPATYGRSPLIAALESLNNGDGVPEDTKATFKSRMNILVGMFRSCSESLESHPKHFGVPSA